jgi:peroxiredoxin
MAKRVGSPLLVAAVAAILVGLVAALVLSFVLEDDGEQTAPPLTLDPNGDATPDMTVVGREAPDFTFEALDGSGEVDFDDFRDGRPALINFFARSCVPCVTEMPDLEAAHQAFGDDVAFVGLSYQESVEDARALVERTGVTYELGRDPTGEIIAAYDGFGLPTTVLVRSDGTVANAYVRRIQPDELERELEALVT